jgi:predicted nucleic acid-binding protein
MKPIIIDTNIVFSALVNKNSAIASFLLEPQQTLLMPKFGFVELFKHKEKICKISKHTPDEILEILYELIRHIDFYDENAISTDALQKAWLLVKDIDPKDVLFVALTIEMNGLLWTGDNKLRLGLEEKVFGSFFKSNTLHKT